MSPAEIVVRMRRLLEKFPLHSETSRCECRLGSSAEIAYLSADLPRPGGAQSSAPCGGFNRSMQHTDACEGVRGAADEVPDAHVLHGQSESADVGTMEGG